MPKRRGKGQLKKFYVSAVIQFEIGARDEEHARRIANEIMFYTPKCYSYGDTVVIEGDEDWHTDDPFSEVGTVGPRDGSFDYESGKKNNED